MSYVTYWKKTSGVATIVVATLVLFVFDGCATSVQYYAPYHPSDHKKMLVLIPGGKPGTIVGRLLDRIDDTPFLIVSIPEEECHNLSDAAKTYDLLRRVTKDIAMKMAKSVNATIVIYYDPEPKKKESEKSSTPALSPAGTQTQNFDDATAPPTTKPEESEVKSFDDIRLAIVDTRTGTLLWYESLAQNPSESAMKETAKRLITGSDSQK